MIFDVTTIVLVYFAIGSVLLGVWSGGKPSSEDGTSIALVLVLWPVIFAGRALLLLFWVGKRIGAWLGR